MTVRISLNRLGEAEALKVILKHEGLPYTTGLGPGLVVFDIDATESEVTTALAQWSVALAELVRLVETKR